jgi:hypothetical protein
MIETATLATYVVGSFLVPLMTKGADKLTDELAEMAGATASDGLVEVAKRLWGKVRGKTRDTDDAPVVDLFEKQPDRMEAALEDVVREMLENDEDFRSEVNGMLEKETAGGTPAWQLMGEYVGVVNAQYAHISGNAQVGGVIVGAHPQSAPTPSPTTSPETDG